MTLLIAFFVWAVRDFGKFNAKRERVFREGLRGEGTIVGVTDGLARRGYDREVVLTLDVVLPGRPVSRAEARVFAGQVKARELVPGARLPVLVDPVDASRVVVDPATGLATSDLSLPR
ncbi:hypothetical protein [Polyangium mundeleinium]|uniref:DUF3592 domain-containing protein n=1 Tax=Polyangium mundeleinium TaxID=2995306 RepID=A0ABT5EM19_9BACT|nr:hypothetical protein [Polyangium mundeleinium]MDC0742509.1 hypothetical protein [Polyangium mundeleinium]